VGDKGARWVVAAPGGSTITFETTITDERPDELIAWKSDEGAEVRNSGRIVFRDAPGGRGTEVEATIAYDPPGGAFGWAAAKLFQREPRIQTRRELKRFKQLMETGEVAVAGRTARHA
ncbi:cyclase, partial [Nitratireductor sp. GCM10026969]